MCNSLNKNSDSKKQLEEMGKNMAMPLPKLTEIDFFFFFFYLPGMPEVLNIMRF